MPFIVPRKTYALALIVLLAATACGGAEAARIDLGTGLRFIPEVADSVGDVGRFPSAVVTSDGRPVVAYFGFPDEVPEGATAEPRPIGAPSVPGVLLATRNMDGVWSRGAAVVAAAIPNVNLAFAPAFDDSVNDLKPGTVTGLALAIDGQDGLHLAWGSADGLWYGTGSSDPASTTKWAVEQVSQSPPEGLSIAVDGSGSPWISFVSASEVRVASGGPGSWGIESVAPVSSCSDGGCSTATAVAAGTPAVAYTTSGGGIVVARPSADRWLQTDVADGGRGVDMVSTGSDLLISYLTDAGVVVASVTAGGQVESSDVAAAPAGSGDSERTSIAVDGSGTASVTWSAPDASLSLSQGTVDGGFEAVDLGEVGAARMPDGAVSADGGVSYVAWFQPGASDLVVGALAEGELAFALPSPTIEPDRGMATTTPGTPTDCVETRGGKVTVVAVGVAFTEGSCIQVSAGEPFQILFDNKDDAAQVGQHNIAIFTSASDLANPLFRGDLVSGPAQATYDVDALDEGQFFYHCDVHPQMTGTVLVTGASGGGGGGGGATSTASVVAMGLAFDTSEIVIPAGTEFKLTMDNQDSGVPHNIAIYPSANDLGTPLFRGDLITGVASIDYTVPALDAGTYYFQCDVHPTMAGTVTVA